MTKIQRIEQDVQRLSAVELADFREWFLRYAAAAWDRQIESDVAAGKLDGLADEARADHAAGRRGQAPFPLNK